MDINAVLNVGFSQYEKGQLNDDCLHAYFCGALNAFLTIGADKSDLIKVLEQYADVPTVASLIKSKQSQSADIGLITEIDNVVNFINRHFNSDSLIRALGSCKKEIRQLEQELYEAYNEIDSMKSEIDDLQYQLQDYELFD